jgi:hypothetical protein
MNRVYLYLFLLGVTFFALFIGVIKRKRPLFQASLILFLVKALPFLTIIAIVYLIFIGGGVNTKIPTDTYKSELIFAQQDLSKAYALYQHQLNNAFVSYQKDTQTYLQEVSTGKETVIEVNNPLLFITPENKYLFISFKTGRAFLVDKNLEVVRSFTFKGGLEVLDPGASSQIFPDENLGSAWLDNKTLWVNEAIFDLNSSMAYKVQKSQYAYFGSIKDKCLNDTINSKTKRQDAPLGYRCYKIVCQSLGSLFDFSQASDPSVLNQKALFNEIIGMVTEDQFACVNQRVRQIYISGNSALLLSQVDGVKNSNFAFSIGFPISDNQRALIKKTFGSEKVREVRGQHLRDYLVDKDPLNVPFANKVPSGKSFKRSIEGLGLCIDTCGGYYTSLTIYDQFGEQAGKINRKRIEFAFPPNERNELFILTERGIEKIIL